LIAAVDQNKTLLSSYVWGKDLSGSFQGAGGVGGLLAVNTTTNGYHLVSYDGNGNVVALVNGTNGVRSAEFDYSPFGETLRATGPAAESMAFQFSNKFTDWESGLVYYGYRYYDPRNGRWESPDPLEEKGGLNLYGFVRITR
jgi:RHS repeat-associated protein